MPDETYDGAYRLALLDSLRTFRATATLLGQVDRIIEEAYQAGDLNEAIEWEGVREKHAEFRPRLARSILQIMALMHDAGMRLPNPRWVTPPWLYDEWHRMLAEKKRLDSP